MIVRAHSQRVAHERADRDLSAAVDVAGRASSRTRAAALYGAPRCPRSSPLARLRRSSPRAPSVVVLPEPVAPQTSTLRRAAHGAPSSSRSATVHVPSSDEIAGREARAAETADRERQTVDRQRRQHDIHSRAVRHARVADRLRLVRAAAGARQQPLDRLAQLGLRGERELVGSSRPSRSTQIGCVPLTSSSSTPGSRRSGSSGPSPSACCAARSATCARVAGLERAGLGVDRFADRRLRRRGGRPVPRRPAPSRAAARAGRSRGGRCDRRARRGPRRT